MITAQGSVATTQGGKYVQQLCKHWAHKLTVDLNGNSGVVTFPIGTVTMNGTSDALRLTITADAAENVDQLKNVIASHLDRFAFREAPLSYEWVS